MKPLLGLQFDTEMPELVNPYLGIFISSPELSDAHLDFILEAADLAREILYGEL